MNLKRSIRVFFLAALLALQTVTSFSAAGVEVTGTSAMQIQSATNGLRTENGKLYFYVNGAKVKNAWKTVAGKTYFFGPTGAAVTGWYSAKQSGSYKTFYFYKSGVLSKSVRNVIQTLIPRLGGTIKAAKVNYYATTKKAMLQPLFNYMKSSVYSYQRAATTLPSGWPASYANSMLLAKKGSCYHFAAAFAYAAKRVTGLPVRIVTGTSNCFNASNWQKHAWVQIQMGSTWYTFDTNAGRFSTRTANWFMMKPADAAKMYKPATYINVIV